MVSQSIARQDGGTMRIDTRASVLFSLAAHGVRRGFPGHPLCAAPSTSPHRLQHKPSPGDLQKRARGAARGLLTQAVRVGARMSESEKCSS